MWTACPTPTTHTTQTPGDSSGLPQVTHMQPLLPSSTLYLLQVFSFYVLELGKQEGEKRGRKSLVCWEFPALSLLSGLVLLSAFFPCQSGLWEQGGQHLPGSQASSPASESESELLLQAPWSLSSSKMVVLEQCLSGSAAHSNLLGKLLKF